MKAMSAAIILGLVFFLGVSAFAGETIVLKKYPDLKIGFTTANFLKVLPVTVENTKKLIDFASDHGFSWIELRDPNAVLTLDECRQIADYARGYIPNLPASSSSLRLMLGTAVLRPGKRRGRDSNPR